VESSADDYTYIQVLEGCLDQFYLLGQIWCVSDQIEYCLDIGVIVVGLVLLYGVQTSLDLRERIWILRLTESLATQKQRDQWSDVRVQSSFDDLQSLQAHGEMKYLCEPV
jgi:hypothetical protein